MTVQRWESVVAPITEKDKTQRDAINQKYSALVNQGICPSCQQFNTGDIFPNSTEYTYYEDSKVVALLETYPRGTGHTIIISKEHYADITDMPVELGCHIITVTHALVNALKNVVDAEKVYMVTMCSGELSHLHFQLIPRLKGEQIGGRVFSSERGVLSQYTKLIAALKQEVQRLLHSSTATS